MVRYILEEKSYSKPDSKEVKVSGTELLTMDINRFDCCLTKQMMIAEYVNNHSTDNYMLYIDNRDNKIRKIATWDM